MRQLATVVIALGVALQLGAVVGAYAWAKAADPECVLEMSGFFDSSQPRLEADEFALQYRMCDAQADPPTRPVWPLGLCAALFVLGTASHRWGHAHRAKRADLGEP